MNGLKRESHHDHAVVRSGRAPGLAMCPKGAKSFARLTVEENLLMGMSGLSAQKQVAGTYL
jgi:ABC-type branched-subunit amino acid transport system ATPase component